jgi:hypothetical protein
VLNSLLVIKACNLVIYKIAEFDRRSFILKSLKSGELLSKHYKNWVTSQVGIPPAPKEQESLEAIPADTKQPKIKQHSSKAIKKDNKMKRLQNKEFGEGKGHKVQDINKNNEVVYILAQQAHNNFFLDTQSITRLKAAGL